MLEPHIFTPHEAQEELDYVRQLTGPVGDMEAWAYTVVTEPDRTRAAVVKALRYVAGESKPEIRAYADAIENGAEL